MTVWEVVLSMFVSLFYIAYIVALIIAFKHRKKMKINWLIALITLPLAPFLVPMDYIDLITKSWRGVK